MKYYVFQYIKYIVGGVKFFDMSKCRYCKKQGFMSWKIGIIKVAVKWSFITCMKSICEYKIKVSGLAMPIGSNRTTYAVWDQTKPCKSWKAVCMLLRVTNGNQIMTHQVKPATTTLSLRESCMEESTLIHWNVFEISCLLCMSFCFVILYVTIWCKDNKLIIYLSNPLKSFMSSVSRHTFSKLFQLRTGHDVLGKYFRTRGIDERNHNCECGQLETVEHVLKECPLHPAERDLLRKVSPELDPRILLDTKKGLGAVVKFLDSLPQLLCWWFAWLSSLLRFYWVSISGIELLGVMYLRFPLAHGYFHGKFGAIERLNLLCALTPLLCQSHRDKY